MNTSDSFMLALVEEDTCPKCLGELDTGWECNKCGYDGADLLMMTDEEVTEVT